MKGNNLFFFFLICAFINVWIGYVIRNELYIVHKDVDNKLIGNLLQTKTVPINK